MGEYIELFNIKDAFALGSATHSLGYVLSRTYESFIKMHQLQTKGLFEHQHSAGTFILGSAGTFLQKKKHNYIKP